MLGRGTIPISTLISKVLLMLQTYQSLIPHALANNLLFPLRTLLFFLQDLVPALAGAHWLEHQPMDCRVTGSIYSQGQV